MMAKVKPVHAIDFELGSQGDGLSDQGFGDADLATFEADLPLAELCAPGHQGHIRWAAGSRAGCADWGNNAGQGSECIDRASWGRSRL